MSNRHIRNALISIKPCYVKSILCGDKTVEIRRRSISLPVGATLWIYSTLPSGRVEVAATIENLISDRPLSLWQEFKKDVCVSRKDFESYFSNTKIGFAIKLGNIREFKQHLYLDELRRELGTFQPPQFCTMLPDGHPVLDLFEQSMTSFAD